LHDHSFCVAHRFKHDRDRRTITGEAAYFIIVAFPESKDDTKLVRERITEGIALFSSSPLKSFFPSSHQALDFAARVKGGAKKTITVQTDVSQEVSKNIHALATIYYFKQMITMGVSLMCNNVIQLQVTITSIIIYTTNN
jgi:hypothetical protein